VTPHPIDALAGYAGDSSVSSDPEQDEASGQETAQMREQVYQIEEEIYQEHQAR
jgi:hypothetical protein